jgi:alanine racemase
MYQPVVEIDLGAVRHNLARVKDHAKGAKILAMVKADGYGHGIVEVAKSLANADALGVARTHEAVELVDAGVTQKIVLMEGCFSLEEYQWAHDNHVQVVIHTPSQLEQFLAFGATHPMLVWLKLDTGMHRLGFTEQEFLKAHQRLSECPHCADLVVMTHFACADDITNPLNENQMSTFEQTCRTLSSPQSVANSATILSRPDRIKDWVRPGIILYGTSPLLGSQSVDFELLPVMTFKANIIAIKSVLKGESVGYGCDWVAQKDSEIAVVGVGYGDGYPRHAKNGTPMLVHSKGSAPQVSEPQRAHLVGRVSMDMITADVTELANITVGDQVTLWGVGLPAESVAEHASTISYTLYCGITKRVKRHYLNRAAVD